MLRPPPRFFNDRGLVAAQLAPEIYDLTNKDDGGPCRSNDLTLLPSLEYDNETIIFVTNPLENDGSYIHAHLQAAWAKA